MKELSEMLLTETLRNRKVNRKAVAAVRFVKLDNEKETVATAKVTGARGFDSAALTVAAENMAEANISWPSRAAGTTRSKGKDAVPGYVLATLIQECAGDSEE